MSTPPRRVSRYTDQELIEEYTWMLFHPDEYSFGRAAHLNTEIKKRAKKAKKKEESK